MELKVIKTLRGTRILLGDTADKKARITRAMEDTATKAGYKRITLPLLQFQETFKDSGAVKHKMFNFQDEADRDLCLAPEYNAVISDLALNQFKHARNMALFYNQECFRIERFQNGVYRQFTQFGIAILNPTINYKPKLVQLARCLLTSAILPAPVGWYDNVYSKNLKVNESIPTEVNSFDIEWGLLGTQGKICVGGIYDGATGFTINIDKVMLMQSDPIPL